MSTRKNKTTKDPHPFKTLFKKFMKDRGIERGDEYIALMMGISRQSTNVVLNEGDGEVGKRTEGLIDPRNAYSFIQIAENLMGEEDLMRGNPIRKFLQPKLDRYYRKERQRIAEEKKANDKRK